MKWKAGYVLQAQGAQGTGTGTQVSLSQSVSGLSTQCQWSQFSTQSDFRLSGRQRAAGTGSRVATVGHECCLPLSIRQSFLKTSTRIQCQCIPRLWFNNNDPLAFSWTCDSDRKYPLLCKTVFTKCFFLPNFLCHSRGGYVLILLLNRRSRTSWLPSTSARVSFWSSHCWKLHHRKIERSLCRNPSNSPTIAEPFAESEIKG